jgi:hypothetical protein
MLRVFGQRFVYVLIAALLLAQQGMVLHAVSHAVDAVKFANQERPDKRAPLSDRHCDLCLTYAQVAAGAAPSSPPLVAAALCYAEPQSSHPCGSAHFTRAYRSRAPPRTV